MAANVRAEGAGIEALGLVRLHGCNEDGIHGANSGRSDNDHVAGSDEYYTVFIDIDSAERFTGLLELNFEIEPNEKTTKQWQNLYIKSLPEPRAEAPSAEEPILRQVPFGWSAAEERAEEPRAEEAARIHPFFRPNSGYF